MPPNSRLLKTDFAALRTLQFVHDLGSFSRAAERLGITQSNVSYTVSILRASFDDPLFVRQGNTMVPTTRCTQIVQQASGLLEEFQGIAREAHFDLGAAKDVVTLSCNHYERMTLLPELLRDLRNYAPGLQLRVLNSLAQGDEQLKRGECDLLIGPVQISGEQVFKRRIMSDTYLCIMDPGNPLTQSDLTVETLAQAQHVVIRFAGGWRPSFLHMMESMGAPIRPRIELNEYGDIGGYVRGTDLVTVLPRRLADLLDADLVRKDLPFAVPLTIDLFWTTRTNRSPLFMWLRDRIARIGRG